MPSIIDADVLSTFAKIKRLDLLAKAFGDDEILICPAVISELKQSKSEEVRDTTASNLFSQASLTKKENNLANNLRKKLGTGEAESIALCKIRKAVFVSNDNQAIISAEKLGIEIVDLETILYFLKDLLGKNQLKQIINAIESKDKVIVVNKEEILK